MLSLGTQIKAGLPHGLHCTTVFSFSLNSSKACLSLRLAVIESPRWRSQQRDKVAKSRAACQGRGAFLNPCRRYHRNKPNMANKIPDRWTNYQALGKRIPGTRFIAFKVPLKRSFESRLQPSQYFGPFDLVQRLQEENQELGLIIDLTFTTRYYKPEDLPESLHYVKIFTAGHEVPSDKTILSFKRAVNKFLQENEHNDKLIGVHCTHGLNRTGYLVCRYLIDVDGVNPKKAMQLFNKSRGHSIERENYIEDLRHGPKRSNAGMEVAEQEPVRGSASQVQSVTPFSRPAPHCGRESLLGPYKSCRPPYPPSGIQRDQPYPPFLPRPPPSRGMRPPGAPRQPFRQDWRGPADSYRSALPVFHHCAGSSGTNGPRPGTSMNGQQPPPHTGSLEEPRRTKKKGYWRARKKERRNPK